MATRGKYGFKYHNTLKISYNHYDSYIEGLGVELFNEIKNYSIDTMKERFDKIIVVNDNDNPITTTIVQNLIDKNYISKNNYREDGRYEWYFLIHEWQGKLKPLMEYDYPYMEDGTLYSDDMIEYQYIINLDEDRFEIYNDPTTDAIVMMPLDKLYKINTVDEFLDYYRKLKRKNLLKMVKRNESKDE